MNNARHYDETMLIFEKANSTAEKEQPIQAQIVVKLKSLLTGRGKMHSSAIYPLIGNQSD